MKTQFTNDEGAFINAGTSEGASKGWNTRRGSGDYEQQANHADRMSAAAEDADQQHKKLRLDSSRTDAFQAHAKAEQAHSKAMKAALKSGNRHAAENHAHQAVYHASQQDSLQDVANAEAAREKGII